MKRQDVLVHRQTEWEITQWQKGLCFWDFELYYILVLLLVVSSVGGGVILRW